MNDVPQEENRGIQEKMKAEEPDLAFYREDFFLGDLHHNRPLYLSGYIGEVKLRQVQVDPGSAINVIPLKKVRKLGIPCLVLQLKKEDEELGAQFLMPIREGVLDLTRRDSDLCAPTQGMALNPTYTLYNLRIFALVPLEPVPWLECRAG